MTIKRALKQTQTKQAFCCPVERRIFQLLTFCSVGISLTVNALCTQRITFSRERTLRFEIPLCVGEQRMSQTIRLHQTDLYSTVS